MGSGKIYGVCVVGNGEICDMENDKVGGAWIFPSIRACVCAQIYSGNNGVACGNVEGLEKGESVNSEGGWKKVVKGVFDEMEDNI